jgi:hypothetical protein
MTDEPSTNDDDPSDESDHAIERRLSILREEHQDLDAAVQALEERPQPDMLQIARLKKKKLALRDKIGRLEDMLMPDIIAYPGRRPLAVTSDACRLRTTNSMAHSVVGRRV